MTLPVASSSEMSFADAISIAPFASLLTTPVAEMAGEAVASGRYKMVVLDEILGSIKAGLVTEEEVLALARSRPPELHLVLTGRGATPAIVEAADLVTEMTEIKHHYKAGIPAQRGIEF